jgi:hypothetical protein
LDLRITITTTARGLGPWQKMDDTLSATISW